MLTGDDNDDKGDDVNDGRVCLSWSNINLHSSKTIQLFHLPLSCCTLTQTLCLHTSLKFQCTKIISALAPSRDSWRSSRFSTWRFRLCQTCRPKYFLLFLRLQVGDWSFPLEAVKQLEELMDAEDGLMPRLSETSAAAVCTHPLLPQVFRPVCQGKAAQIVFSELGKTFKK